MEHRINLDFSMAVLRNELTRMQALERLIKDGHTVKKQLRRKILATEIALFKLQGTEVPEQIDFDYPISVIRANLNWLEKQASSLKSSQDMVEEIEYVTKLLKDGRSIKKSN